MSITLPETSPPSRAPRVLVVGAGAVGSYYGAQLARAGAQVSLVCRTDLDTVRRRGIRIESLDGDFLLTPHQVFATAAEVTDFPDYILVTLKALPEIDTVALIQPAVGPGTVIVLLQNGINVEAAVAAAFPGHEVLGALAFVCLSRVAPGVVRHFCFGRLVVGRYPGGACERARELAAWFQRAGVACKVSETIQRDRWAKLVWNAPFNPISVLGRADTRQMMASPAVVALIREVMAEVLAVAMAEGYSLPEDAIARNLADTERMEPYRTSMLLDHVAGRPLEMEAILGEPIRLARVHGIPVPRLETLHALLTLRGE